MTASSLQTAGASHQKSLCPLSSPASADARARRQRRGCCRRIDRKIEADQQTRPMPGLRSSETTLGYVRTGRGRRARGRRRRIAPSLPLRRGALLHVMPVCHGRNHVVEASRVGGQRHISKHLAAVPASNTNLKNRSVCNLSFAPITSRADCSAVSVTSAITHKSDIIS